MSITGHCFPHEKNVEQPFDQSRSSKTLLIFGDRINGIVGSETLDVALKRGRELGYPTANLRLDPTCGLRHGIYAVRVGIGSDRYDGVASFGRRPMFDVGTVLLEVFLFNFSGDLYGQTIDVAFIDWIRHELKLDTIEDLIRRMDEDSRLARIAHARSGEAFPQLGELAV